MKWALKLTARVQHSLRVIRGEEKGQAFSEYAIIIGVIAIVLIASAVLFRTAIVGMFNRIVTALNVI